MGLFGIFVNKSKQNRGFEPNYDNLSPDEVEFEFKLISKNIQYHTGDKLAQDLDIVERLAKQYHYMPAIYYCIDNFPRFGRGSEEYERLGCELGDAVCSYRYYSLERISAYTPEQAEECIKKVVSLGAPGGYITLGDYYLARGDSARARDIYGIAMELNVRGAVERLMQLDGGLSPELYASQAKSAEPQRGESGLSARLRRDREG